MILPRLTVLEDQYAIGRVLDEDRPFEVTYQAWNLMTEDQVVLKEYFPRTLARREEGGTQLVWDEADEELYRYGLEQFLKESEALAALDQQNLVREIERFEANGTAYRALEHHAGAMLASVLKQQGGKLAPKTALGIIVPVLNGLQAAHGQDLVHAGITPEAIFLAKSGRPLLIDFRTAQAMLARRMKKPHLLAEEGYAAPEQYLSEGPQGPWTDVYGVAATLYHMMTGKVLPAAYERLEDDPVPQRLQEVKGVPDALCEMLQEALAMEPAERIRSVDELQERLKELAKKKEIKESGPATVAAGGSAAAAAAISEAARFDEGAADGEEVSDEEVATTAAAEAQAAADVEPEEIEGAVDEALAAEALEPEAADSETAEAEEVEAEPVAAEEIEAEEAEAEPVAAEEIEAEEAEAEEEDTVLATPPEAEAETPAAEATEEPVGEEEAVEADEETEAVPVAATADAPEAEAEADEAEPRPSRAPDRLARRRAAARREKEKSTKRIPVLAALLAVVAIAALGGYLVMNPSGEGDRFAYFKAKGDSLFERAEYAAAKTEYEQALSIQTDERVTARISELEQRIAEQEEAAYLEQIQMGDERFQRGDSLMQAGESSEALQFFAEANRAYRQAAQLRPEGDSVAVVKAQQAEEALSAASSESAGGEEGEEVDPEELNRQLYQNYRDQGDVALRQGNLEEAQRKFEEALEYRPGDRYARNRLNEIETRRREAEVEAEFQDLMAQGNALCEQGQCGEAVDEFQRALELKPGNQTAQEALAQAEEAREAAESKAERYQYFRGQGDTYLAQGNFDAAIASYENALEQRPGDQYTQQKIAEAREALEEERRRQEEQEQANMTDDGVYLVAEEPPRLIGGINSLHERMNYPSTAIRAGIEGRVYVQFVVDEEGNVQNPEVIRGIGAGCDEEAVRVISQAKFEPGRIDGEPVPVRHTLYIHYQLEE